MKSKLSLWNSVFLLVVILVGGCATAYKPTPLPVTHPANAAAPEAPLPPPSLAFQPEPLPLSTAELMPAQNAHAGHGATTGMHGGH